MTQQLKKLKKKRYDFVGRRSNFVNINIKFLQNSVCQRLLKSAEISPARLVVGNLATLTAAEYT